MSTTAQPTTPITLLHDRVNRMFEASEIDAGVRNKLTAAINKIVDDSDIRKAGYRVPSVEVDTMLRVVRDAKTLKNLTTTSSDAEFEAAVAPIVRGFINKSNAPTEQKGKVNTYIDTRLGAAASDDYKKLNEKINKSKEEFLGGGVTGWIGRGVVSVGAIVLIWKNVKAAFKPREVVNDQGHVEKKGPGFWNMLGRLALAGGIAYAGWNLGKEGKSVKQTLSDTRSWVERELMRRQAKVEFSPSRT